MTEASDDGNFVGGERAEKTPGIVGTGSIGGRIAEFASAVGMYVIGMKHDPTTGPDAVDDIYGPDGLYDVLTTADSVVLSCPLTERGLIGNSEIGAMNDDAVLVNVARGAVVDQSALTTVLQQRTIRGAALDVFETEPLPSESPLWALLNVIITPPMAGTRRASTTESPTSSSTITRHSKTATLTRCATTFSEQVK